MGYLWWLNIPGIPRIGFYSCKKILFQIKKPRYTFRQTMLLRCGPIESGIFFQFLNIYYIFSFRFRAFNASVLLKVLNLDLLSFTN